MTGRERNLLRTQEGTMDTALANEMFYWTDWHGFTDRNSHGSLPPKTMRARRPPTEVLGRRRLNRALLARQLLLRRSELSVPAAVEKLVGLQAQIPGNPYVALWSRLEGFRPEDLSRLIASRRAVRATLMRATIHLVTARDYHALRPVLQPALDRNLHTASQWGRHLTGVDLPALVEAGRALVDEPQPASELGRRLGERWPDRDPTALSYAIHALLPLVQVPPRGLWGGSGRAAWMSAETWLGRTIAGDPAPDRMVLRYLAAFGPATAGDVQTWSGLAGLRTVIERLRPRLRAFRDERGRELLDLPGAPRPDPDTPAPPRFLPEYDNVLLSHADRTRIATDEDRRRLTATTGPMASAVLLDGFVRASWRIEREGTKATLLIRPFGRLARADRRAVAEEGSKVLEFLAAAATRRDVRFLRA
jgi:hypothetical protein